MAWICAKCTFRNLNARHLACLVCSTPRTDSVASSASKESESTSEGSGKRARPVIVIDDDDDDDASERAKKRVRKSEARLPNPFKLIRADVLGDGPGNKGAENLAELVRDPSERVPAWVVLSSFMFETKWLVDAWPQLATARRIVVMHGMHDIDKPDSRALLPSHIELNSRIPKELHFRHPVTGNAQPFAFKYGCHHAKFIFIGYSTGIRVIILTANLIEVDFRFKSNVAYVQNFPIKTASSPRSSSFESALRDYVRNLETHGGRFSERHAWPGMTVSSSDDSSPLRATLSEALGRFDYSSALCELLPTVPGWHLESDLKKYGHPRLRDVLEQDGAAFPSALIGSQSVLVAQFSSLSAVKKKYRSELANSFSAGLSTDGRPLGEGKLEFVWPTVEEVRRSCMGYASGGGMPARDRDVSDPHRAGVLRRWIGSDDPQSEDGNASPLVNARRCVMPHMKTYFRVSRDGRRFAWLALTSANISRAAWGQLQKGNSQLFCRHYELGVVFTPRSLGRAISVRGPENRGAKQGALAELISARRHASGDKKKKAPASFIFNLPFRLPTSAYTESDTPWHWDGRWPGRPDAYGRTSLAD
eukprot:g1463.t1